MKKCKSCQKEIDDKAKKCPHCQTDQRIWFARHPILTTILAIIVIGLLGSGASDKSPSANSENASPTAEQATATESAKPQVEATTVTEKQPSVPTEYKSALSKATSYANTMHMSKQGVYDQLVSAYGEKFSAEAAQYAIDNVKADWNANALAKAKSYQDTMNMSPAAIHDQLTSSYGEKFTAAEADYAIAHLN